MSVPPPTKLIRIGVREIIISSPYIGLGKAAVNERQYGTVCSKPPKKKSRVSTPDPLCKVTVSQSHEFVNNQEYRPPAVGGCNTTKIEHKVASKKCGKSERDFGTLFRREFEGGE